MVYVKVFTIALFVILLISGCTVNMEERLSGLEKRTESIDGRLGALESRADSIEQRQVAVEDYLTKQKTETTAKAVSMSNEEVQTALRNAGLYTGAIDGKIGPNTDKAIREFQKANGLEPDGVVGTKTKALLARYLT